MQSPAAHPPHQAFEPLRITLLGGFQVSVGQRPITDGAQAEREVTPPAGARTRRTPKSQR